MGGSIDALKIAFYVLLIAALVLAIYGHYHPPPPPPPPPPQPQLVTNQPAGLAYNGPATTALAGYYCIESINSSNGYSIQLNALLSNGLWIQDSYTLVPNESGPFFNMNVHGRTLLYKNGSGFINAPCAWLVIDVKNGYAYFGYSLDGRSIVWYDSYPVGNATIKPGPSTELVLAGYGNGVQAQLGSGTLVYLALFYWNGTNWAPALVSVFMPVPGYTHTAETVNNAYVFTNGACGGVVSWPSPVNNTMCPVPGFKP